MVPSVPAASRIPVGASSFVASVAAPFCALSAMRVSLLMTNSNCALLVAVEDVMTGPVDPTNAPLQWPEYGAMHRGAVIGNLAVWVLSVLVAIVVSYALGDKKARSFRDKAASMHLPGYLGVTILPLLQQLVTSSVLLVAEGGTSPDAWSVWDRVMGSIGLTACTAICVGCVRVLDPRAEKFAAVGAPVVDRHRRRHVPLALRFVKAMTREEVRWSTRGKRDATFVLAYGALFEACRIGRHWWQLVELALSLAVASAAGIVPRTVTGCRAEMWFVFVCVVAAATAVAILRPMNTGLERCLMYTTYGFQVALVVCSVSDASDRVTAAIGLAAAVWSTCLVLLSLVRPLATRCKPAAPAKTAAVADRRPEKEYELQSPNDALAALIRAVCTFQQQQQQEGVSGSAGVDAVSEWNTARLTQDANGRHTVAVVQPSAFHVREGSTPMDSPQRTTAIQRRVELLEALAERRGQLVAAYNTSSVDGTLRVLRASRALPEGLL